MSHLCFQPADCRSSGDPPDSASLVSIGALEFLMYLPFLDLQGFRGLELRSSCWHSNHLTLWTIPWSPTFPLLKVHVLCGTVHHFVLIVLSGCYSLDPAAIS